MQFPPLAGRLAILMGIAGGAFAQPASLGASDAAARVTERMQSNLLRLPNYTCSETIERTRRASGGAIVLEDTLRLEVALVNGQEIFAWPGSTEFQDTELKNLIGSGTYGNGAFGVYAEMIFFSGGPTLQPRGLTELAGEPVLRFDFRVPRSESSYQVTVDNRRAILGYSGSVYANPETYDLRRLEIQGEEIPVELGLKTSADQVDYQRLRIGEDDFLLPVQNRLTMETQESINQNLVRFTGCRKFSGESELVFDDPEFAEAAEAQIIREVTLPPDTELQLVIETDVHMDSAAIGDPITATLNRRVQVDGQELVPKGAIASGRILRMDRLKDYYVVDIRLTDLNWPGGHAVISGTFDRIALGALVSGPELQQLQRLIFVRRPGPVRLGQILVYWRTQ